MNFDTAPSSLSATIDALPDGLPILVRAAGAVANKQRFAAYLVGGTVRDLLLDLPHLDVDIVIDGHGAAVARAMANRFGGHVLAHERFGTATWTLAESSFAGSAVAAVDFITARRESYSHPGALPTVEPSGIDDDLARRDFTINALAIHLDAARFGELLDPHSGLADLRAGVVRALHAQSFMDDPTRIFRAVRYEQRFNFQMDARTESLVADALDVLPRVSGARLTNELWRIGAERAPEKAFKRLAALNVLRAIHPALNFDDAVETDFRRLADVGSPLPLFYLGALTRRLSPDRASSVAERLALSGDQTTFIVQSSRLHEMSASLSEPDLAPSRIAHLLDPFCDEALQVAATLSDDALARERIAQYRAQWRAVKPLTDGERLKALGIPPGPIYRKILETLRDARLDGKVATREGEERLALMIVNGER